MRSTVALRVKEKGRERNNLIETNNHAVDGRHLCI